MNTKPLLIELFTEELPPKALKKLGEAFAAGIEAGLRADGLLSDGASATSFATPRRIGVRIDAVLAEAPAKAIKERLMPLAVAVAKDAAGAASIALKKKLIGLGREALIEGFPNASSGSDSIVIESDGKADYVYLVGLSPGRTITLNHNRVGSTGHVRETFNQCFASEARELLFQSN